MTQCVRVVSGLHELAKHMFNAVTIVYAVYFRNQNPLAYDWNTAQVQKELGDDFELLECFQNIKTEITSFCECPRGIEVVDMVDLKCMFTDGIDEVDLDDEELSEHDVLFKTLVVEQDRKMLAARTSPCAWAHRDGPLGW